MSHVEIDCEVIAETADALLVSDGKQEVWIPRSQISDQSEDKGKVTSIFISEWFADKKGLI